MEDKENFGQCNGMPSTLSESQASQKKPLKPLRRLIRRTNKQETKKKTRINFKNKRKATRKSPQQGIKVMQSEQDIQFFEKGSDKLLQKHEKPRSWVSTKKSQIQKIEFDIKFLTKHMQVLYQRRQKINNTQLVVPGVKFVKELSKKPNSINKWKEALIIYQEFYKGNQRCHFGLLLKIGSKIITFDGITKLWPIKSVNKSFHWQVQPDAWSCGYRALFWLGKVQEVGLHRWVQQFESQQNDQEIQIEC